jgi:cleavage and polyadenylation specificity factor subunit 2
MAAAQVTPLLGAYSDGPACSLLQIGAFNILLDCGWSQQFELADLENLRIAVEEMRIDYVLLSHSDLEVHCACLVVLVGLLACLLS